MNRRIFIDIQSLFHRYERLEDQLHDLTDLHQHETTNLKQDLASIEEKVAYQAYERSRDMQVNGSHILEYNMLCSRLLLDCLDFVSTHFAKPKKDICIVCMYVSISICIYKNSPGLRMSPSL